MSDRDHFKECLNDLDSCFGDAQDILYEIGRSIAWMTIKERSHLKNMLDEMKATMDGIYRFMKKDLG